jgi:hypothetical protein
MKLILTGVGLILIGRVFGISGAGIVFGSIFSLAGFIMILVGAIKSGTSSTSESVQNLNETVKNLPLGSGFNVDEKWNSLINYDEEIQSAYQSA